MSAARRRTIVFVALTALVTSAQDCITFNDEAVIAVNVENLTDTFPITVGATNFAFPAVNRCEDKAPTDYINENFEEPITGSRLVDGTVQTLGTFSGNIVGGRITVRNMTTLAAETDLVSYSGSWNAFNTEQSLLTSSLLTRNPAGVTVLQQALIDRHTIRFCEYGTFSVPATAGLSVVTRLYAQVDIQPGG